MQCSVKYKPRRGIKTLALCSGMFTVPYKISNFLLRRKLINLKINCLTCVIFLVKLRDQPLREQSSLLTAYNKYVLSAKGRCSNTDVPHAQPQTETEKAVIKTKDYSFSYLKLAQRRSSNVIQRRLQNSYCSFKRSLMPPSSRSSSSRWMTVIHRLWHGLTYLLWNLAMLTVRCLNLK